MLFEIPSKPKMALACTAEAETGALAWSPSCDIRLTVKQSTGIRHRSVRPVIFDKTIWQRIVFAGLLRTFQLGHEQSWFHRLGCEPSEKDAPTPRDTTGLRHGLCGQLGIQPGT